MSNVKPLWRTLRTGLTFLSFLLFVATLVLWFRSRSHLDEFHIYRPVSYRSIWSIEGRIYIFIWSAREQFWGEASMGLGGGDLPRFKYSVPLSRQFGPFGYNHTASTNPALVIAEGHIIMFPHWFVLLLGVLPPTFHLRRVLKHRSAGFRIANSLCLRCGYDIRATPDRCPECGRENPATAGAGS